ncbi:uncharacterized protein At3g28850 [Andrographis paniculata]|uniref:uncharacterized protein At3g28850 n=1 Tax=Andrographis paniculata TaxID=175694 RepID=UPI0021E9663C|nr:uncharacterized protein At3g28850 [Andrographis paniculata]
MGCSASRPANFIPNSQNPNPNPNPTPNSSSSFPNSQLQSPFRSFSDPSSTPASRTLSLPTPLVHHPPLRKGDSNHFVSLTSTTYGSLPAEEPPAALASAKPYDPLNPTAQIKPPPPDSAPSDDPLSPDSVINTWELMEGLDDDGNGVEDLFSFDYGVESSKKFDDYPVSNSNSKPLWRHLSEESLLAKMDRNVVSSYRKALLSRRPRERLKDLLTPQSPESDIVESGGGSEDRIIVYYTSLRGIRKTYEDCCMARSIIRGFLVRVDERDISMDRSYRTELEEALKGREAILPQVFIRGKRIGGAEEIKRLNETGELAKLLEGFPITDSGRICTVCGDARFVPCKNCSGSRKVYDDGNGELRRCPECNENGLIRCSGCCH